MSINERHEDQLLVELSDESSSLAEVRVWMRELLAGIGEDQEADTLLVVTELMHSADAHAGGPGESGCGGCMDRGVVRIEVDDGSPGRLPVLGRHQSTGLGGRELLIVNRLSSGLGEPAKRWRQTVWAEVRV